ncbi:U4/U6.U5 small nuclear ribonucleoprotein 27 kDa protein-like [Actinia tenebrosa]|uniref:U4/U6.U5 small nuclear ribonucleoprotein 27 kDa protein-like n=1 Tax=Actinia tenebrosa TaxID=6105 RepID=A0A6P8H8D4_ACTTE|nr:U4/U6.U5 small nuclear ribonucleoprotein 27 kDa protein-like [Actinia tenebrosa]
MARYSSDSDDDRRSKEKRSKSSRKRDRRSRSRSRDRRRRSRSRSRSSRSHRRRSRSRSVDRKSSEDRYYSSKKSRSDRDRRSRSPGSSRNSEERQREKRDKDTAVEKTKQRIKEALSQAETNDDDLLKAKERKKLGKEVIPNADAIAEIESNEFVQQSFTSSYKDKQSTVDKSQPDILISSTKQTPVVPINVFMDASNSEGLFAARVLEDESTKMERWIKKMTATRNKMLAAGSLKH